MNHLPFTIICRIADGDISQDELAAVQDHWNNCRSCQREIELQKSLMKSLRNTSLANPSADFTQLVINAINPSRKRRWYEWLLHNLGNIIAMASVLSFLGYVFSVASTDSGQTAKPERLNPIMDYFKILQNGSQQLSNYLSSKSFIPQLDASHPHTIYFALIALILLVFMDRIANRFFRHYKLNQ
jgi:hypothetical protein